MHSAPLHSPEPSSFYQAARARDAARARKATRAREAIGACHDIDVVHIFVLEDARAQRRASGSDRNVPAHRLRGWILGVEAGGTTQLEPSPMRPILWLSAPSSGETHTDPAKPSGATDDKQHEPSKLRRVDAIRGARDGGREERRVLRTHTATRGQSVILQ